jgi:phosphate acetyltransferase
MARTLLVVPTAAGASLARTCLEVVRALDRQGVNVGFVKPVAQPRDDGGPDRSVALISAPPHCTLQSHSPRTGWSGSSNQVDWTWCSRRQSPPGSPSMINTRSWWLRGSVPVRPKLYASGLNQALARPLDADVLLAAGWPTADAAEGGHRGDHTAEPGPDQAAGTAESLAERLAITASGYSSVSTNA